MILGYDAYNVPKIVEKLRLAVRLGSFDQSEKVCRVTEFVHAIPGIKNLGRIGCQLVENMQGKIDRG